MFIINTYSDKSPKLNYHEDTITGNTLFYPVTINSNSWENTIIYTGISSYTMFMPIAVEFGDSTGHSASFPCTFLDIGNSGGNYGWYVGAEIFNFRTSTTTLTKAYLTYFTY